MRIYVDMPITTFGDTDPAALVGTDVTEPTIIELYGERKLIDMPIGTVIEARVVGDAVRVECEITDEASTTKLSSAPEFFRGMLGTIVGTPCFSVESVPATAKEVL